MESLAELFGDVEFSTLCKCSLQIEITVDLTTILFESNHICHDHIGKVISKKIEVEMNFLRVDILNPYVESTRSFRFQD